MSAKKKTAPVPSEAGDACMPSKEHAFLGMWKDREDMKDPVAYIRKMREPRYTWDRVLGVIRTER